jgi:carboxymethylenebutenolidase
VAIAPEDSMTTKRVKFESPAGTAEGEVAEPAGSGKAPAVVLIQEYWGVNDHIRSLASRLAAAGFLVIAPDLYEGKTTKSADEAGKLMQSLDWAKAIAFIDGAAKYALAHPRSNGKVGVIGFCMGGALALASAARLSEFAAVVPFYGVPPLEQTPWEKLRAPVQAHFSATDQWASPASAEAVKSKLASHGTPMELHIYDAGHAFMNDTRPEVHDPTEAKKAWDRATAFLHSHLG